MAPWEMQFPSFAKGAGVGDAVRWADSPHPSNEAAEPPLKRSPVAGEGSRGVEVGTPPDSPYPAVCHGGMDVR